MSLYYTVNPMIYTCRNIGIKENLQKFFKETSHNKNKKALQGLFL